MTWAVAYSPSARRDLHRLDIQTARRIITAIERYAQTEHGDVKRLRGAGEEYRLRVGDWRVRFEYDRDARIIRVLHILPRGRAYRA